MSPSSAPRITLIEMRDEIGRVGVEPGSTIVTIPVRAGALGSSDSMNAVATVLAMSWATSGLLAVALTVMIWVVRA